MLLLAQILIVMLISVRYMLIFVALLCAVNVACVYADTDISIEINAELEGEVDDVNVDLEMCSVIEEMSPKEEEPKDRNSDLKGKWGECESHEECETNLCLCYLCVDIRDFVPH